MSVPEDTRGQDIIDPAVIDGASVGDMHLILVLSALRELPADDTTSLVPTLQALFGEAEKMGSDRMMRRHGWDPVGVGVADGMSVGEFRDRCVRQLAKGDWWADALAGPSAGDLLKFAGLS